MTRTVPFRLLPVVAALLVPSLSAATDPLGRPRLGFFPASQPVQERFEGVFMGVPSPERAEGWLHTLTEEPHVAGTPADKNLAEMVRDKLKEFGFEASITSYSVLLNYPKSVSLKMLEPAVQELSLVETGNLRDKDSYSSDAFPAFHGYGASGTAAGQVIYANYGSDEDFKKLDAMEISVKGRIVLVRYGGIFRGLKVREAQEHGAAGVIIYSDPADDGYMKGDIYPDGPMRPPGSLQRGSVQFLSYGPGDPQTPGYASTPSAKRVAQDKLPGIPKIPSLPISYGEAEKILRALAGPRVPDPWQGGLPFAYHVGPGPAKLEMKVDMDYAVRPIWDVFGKIKGSAEPDRWVILGNHRDAWTYGAVDPNSGTASFLETARGLGAAVKAGWKPRRTIILASWDGEEYGLLGSTEWGEDLSDELSKKAVTYVNLDSSVTGPDLDMSGMPSLRNLVIEIADAIPDPKRGKSIGYFWRNSQREAWNKEEPIFLDAPVKAFEPTLDPLGSGSDYTVFSDHLGIASMNFGFNGSYGVYHSTLDNFFWMKSFGDPEFLYHAVAAKLYGMLAMRLGGAEVVPLRYVPYATALTERADELRRSAIMEQRKAAHETDADEPEDPTKKKTPLSPDWGPLQRALQRFATAAAEADAAVAALESKGSADASTLARVNDAWVGVERRFLSSEGLSGRPWFKHVLDAPGRTTGYAAWTFPGLTQAVHEHDPAMWDKEYPKVLQCLDAAARALSDAASAAR
ncbi:MAG TPA: M28 family metallopeptidase [Candidatus Polarisedimenticolia bacterium]|nr:M28 family metallopeptidase [Candidatus Polarisedimenticolia bacterium]